MARTSWLPPAPPPHQRGIPLLLFMAWLYLAPAHPLRPAGHASRSPVLWFFSVVTGPLTRPVRAGCRPARRSEGAPRGPGRLRRALARAPGLSRSCGGRRSGRLERTCSLPRRHQRPRGRALRRRSTRPPRARRSRGAFLVAPAAIFVLDSCSGSAPEQRSGARVRCAGSAAGRSACGGPARACRSSS